MRERAKHDAYSLVWGGAPTVATGVSRLADWSKAQLYAQKFLLLFFKKTVLPFFSLPCRPPPPDGLS